AHAPSTGSSAYHFSSHRETSVGESEGVGRAVVKEPAAGKDVTADEYLIPAPAEIMLDQVDRRNHKVIFLVAARVLDSQPNEILWTKVERTQTGCVHMHEGNQRHSLANIRGKKALLNHADVRPRINQSGAGPRLQDRPSRHSDLSFGWPREPELN